MILLRINRAPSHRGTLNYRWWDDECAIHPKLPLDRQTVLDLCVNYSPGSWGIGQVNVILFLKVLSVLGIGSFKAARSITQMTQRHAQVLVGFSPWTWGYSLFRSSLRVKEFQARIKNKASILLFFFFF